MVNKEKLENWLEQIEEMLELFPFIKMSENEDLWKIKNWYLLKLKHEILEESQTS